ncbi:putative conserved secreted protein [Synechococcus sp. SYN20]|uniref:N-acetylmuramoyl-L-alanine amidase n=1 Tax=Synechococcus sp. SYN20 TaxID=1050714 RepID=UPI001644389F|nr:N-acetylmuramoyl-L-alanine amidase [Synechococcus sp. SYN20]QNJ24903.1 putative conserved secreted protein [Synechococcus sp. SYN20]
MPPIPAWMQRKRVTIPISVILLSMVAQVLSQAKEQSLLMQGSAAAKSDGTLPPQPVCPTPANPDPLLGARTRKPGRWVGTTPMAKNSPIVVMAGHADSQGMDSAGTPGFAVGMKRQAPMDARMRDELYWNLKVQAAVVRLGKARALKISAYNPPALTIRNNNHPKTNWSQARVRSAKGDYILEIHFDAYSPYGFGSGLIPALNRPLNTIDESLGKAFGRFPRLFRGGLGGPRRGIGILEIGMLEPPLEQKLRNPNTQRQTIDCLALRVVDALEKGVNQSPDEGGNGPQGSDPQTNSADG